MNIITNQKPLAELKGFNGIYTAGLVQHVLMSSLSIQLNDR